MNLRQLLHQRAEQWALIAPGAGMLEAFVAKHGVEGTAVAKHGYRMGRQKECFANAAKLALRSPELRYCEGYALRPWLGIPIHHGWCLDEAGGVIDTTWRGKDLAEVEYVGIIFDETVLMRELCENRVYGILDPGMINIRLLREIDAPLVDEMIAASKERIARMA